MCGRPNALHKEWHEEKAREAESLRQAARDVTDAREAVRAAMAAARRLVSLDEGLLKRAEAVGLEEQARAALRHSEGAAWTTPEESTVTPDELANPILSGRPRSRRYDSILNRLWDNPDGADHPCFHGRSPFFRGWRPRSRGCRFPS